MKKFVLLVILAVFIAAIPAVVSADQQVGVGSVGSIEPPSSPAPAQQSAQPAPAPYNPYPDPSVSSNRGEKGDKGDTGCSGPRGPRGLRGHNGVTKVVYKKVIVKSKDACGIYRHLKTWNPASQSYVDARDNRTLEKANAYAKGLVDGSRPSEKPSTTSAPTTTIVPTPTTPPCASQFDWAKLILWLIILLILVGILLFWLANRGPKLRNEASFWSGGRRIGTRKTAVGMTDVCRQKPGKDVRNVSAGDTTYGRTATRAAQGDILRHRLRFRNDAHTPISMDQVWISASSDENLSYVPGSAFAYVNHKDYGRVAVPDEMMTQMLYGGRVLRASDIPGIAEKLPAKSSLYIVRDMTRQVQEADHSGLEFVDLTTPAPPAPAEPEPAPDTPLEVTLEPETVASPAQGEAQPAAQPATAQVETPEPATSEAEEATDEDIEKAIAEGLM